MVASAVSISNVLTKYFPPITHLQICPLTGRVFDHPVVTKQGRRYERSGLLAFLQNGHNSRDPMTGEYLSPASVITDRALLTRIQLWKQLTGRDAESRRHHDLGNTDEYDKEYYGATEVPTVEEDVILLAFESVKSVSINTPAA